ncbi:GyrI-like domain-containing protein [Methylobacillus flagellatus]|uniref:GyrI-like small molecule binding domain-containing protein n=1 Tax=Methylobacillus flagellatus (strain ATCC 51484 / DSM 6875 / VKM B-1610 / KT) TaxID=265072 RepID=Q1GYI9_METFK|nr:GyrI-like domain-containing protein [Methylobacillus flagellatus]ABE50698.1 conserved hypothetical protein [Methylobacillus flagellatus KT]
MAAKTVKKQLPYFLLVFLIPVTLVLWWWGLFSSADVEIAERGNYRYAYLEADGPYSKLSSKQEEVLHELVDQNIQPGPEITLIFSDPRTTPYKELHARAGFIIDADAKPVAPIQVDTVPVRKVFVASIKAHPLLAYGKTYSKVLEFVKSKDMPLNLPTVEIVDDSVLSVEMPLNPVPESQPNAGVSP